MNTNTWHFGSTCKDVCNIQNIYVPCFNQAKCLSCGRQWEDGIEIQNSKAMEYTIHTIHLMLDELKRENTNMRLTELKPEYVDLVPEIKQQGILYISKLYQTAIHLCACGCGKPAVTPLYNNQWTLTEHDGLITLRPSIGNFNGENPYHAHYYITNNKIEWL